MFTQGGGSPQGAGLHRSASFETMDTTEGGALHTPSSPTRTMAQTVPNTPMGAGGAYPGSPNFLGSPQLAPCTAPHAPHAPHGAQHGEMPYTPQLGQHSRMCSRGMMCTPGGGGGGGGGGTASSLTSRLPSAAGGSALGSPMPPMPMSASLQLPAGLSPLPVGLNQVSPNHNPNPDHNPSPNPIPNPNPNPTLTLTQP